MRKIKKILILIFAFFTFRTGISQINIEQIFNIPVGGKDNEIVLNIYQESVDFDIGSNGELYLLDFTNNKIKIFSKEGKYLHSLSTPEYKIQVINFYKNNLVLLTSPSNLLVLSLKGEILFNHNFNIYSPHFLHAIYNDDLLFLTKVGSVFFREDLYIYKLDIEFSDSDKLQRISLAEKEYIKDAYDPDAGSFYLPVEKEYYPYLKKLDVMNIASLSKKYVIIRLFEGDFNDESTMYLNIYYAFIKNKKVFKKIGIIPREKTGLIHADGWSRGHRVYGDSLYVLGSEYTEENRRPINVIISRIDLSDIENLPSVEPNWK